MERAPATTLMLIGAYNAVQTTWAVDYPLPQVDSHLVGQNRTYTVQEGDKNLQTIARKFDTAAVLTLEANNAIVPIPKPGALITIPSQLLLPDAPREGIIVNLMELRLYYFLPGENIVQIFPVSIGLQGLETPVVETRAGRKVPNPTWTSTSDIRKHSLKRDITLPPIVPVGPSNPLGCFALRLAHGSGEYLIHDAGAPGSVGLRVSSDCIRVNTPDIKALFAQIRIGTPVRVINEPVKYLIEPNGVRYVEAHRPLSPEEEQGIQIMSYVLPVGFAQFKGNEAMDNNLAERALHRYTGYPVAVTAGQASITSDGPGVRSA